MLRSLSRKQTALRLALALAFGVAIAPATSAAEVPPVQSAAVSARFVAGLDEPLIAAGPTSATENAHLESAMKSFRREAANELDFAERAMPLVAFLEAHPDSPWRVSLLTNLGIGYYRDGYFTRAFETWRDAWNAGKSSTDPTIKALTDRAVGELARMHARVGHADELEQLFAEIGERPISGAATEMIAGAREGLWMFRNDPGTAYLCGPMALKNLLVTLRAAPKAVNALYAERSGPNGFTLAQVSALATKAGLPHQLVRREAGQPVPVPSVINWKVNHFAAIVEARDARYRVQDPTFASGDLWVTQAAIDAESSGYFLVPRQVDQGKWRAVATAEASKVYGMGYTSTNEPDATKPEDKSAHNSSDPSAPNSRNQPPSDCGMCVADAKLMVVSLNLNDTPVGYVPAKGPSVKVRISYNQREAGQPAVFTFSNLSPKWSMNFMSWIQDNPSSAGGGVTRFVGGGGYTPYTSPYTYSTSTGQFSPDRQGQAVLVRIPATGPLQAYEYRLPDGSKQVYAKTDGATSNPRRVFLTSVVDPAGNAVTLSYDNQLRLTTIADAVGRLTTFQYTAASPLLITRITDPFGRYASLSYDANGRLASITDVIGLQSSFGYDASGLVNSMTTPYGTSTFAYGSDGTTRFLETQDPMGLRERVEFQHTAPGMTYSDPVVPPGYDNRYLYYRNTFYWDKAVYPAVGRDFLKAQITHWLHNPQGQTSPIVESTKAPLENRVWNKYPNQSAGYLEGTTGTPIGIARVLDDGSTQESKFTYNPYGLPLTATDPLGRKTFFDYAPNNVDVQAIRQQVTSGGATAMLAAFTYNTQHRPQTYTDAAGKTTTYGYNGSGQLTSIMDALGRTTTFDYDALGRLTTITNANGAIQETRGYDALDRLTSRTDSEGHTVTYGYDNLDRLTQIAYPDGTTTIYGYTRLDLTSVKDRLGRMTTYGFDANRRLTAVTDPLNRTTSFGYFGNGTLYSITDSKNNTTIWERDLQTRPISKRFANGGTEIYTYESTTSRLKSVRDALNQTRTTTYFNDDQLKSIGYSGAVNATAGVSFAYDPFFPRRTSMTDGLGTTTWTYHPVGSNGALKLASEDGPYAANDTVAYVYDELGRLTNRTVDAAGESYGYDALDRLTSHTGALGAFTMGYLGQSDQITSRTATSGMVGTQWQYDSNANDRRLLAIKNSGQARSFGLATLPENLITGITESVGNTVQKTWTYGYDDAYRLTSAAPSSGNSFSYGYDPADNLTSLTTGSTTRTATHNNLNQIVALGGVPYVYDAVGNLVDDGLRTYAWDAENRLIAIGYKGVAGKQTVMRYDGLGRRLAIIDTASTGTTETRYLWCGESLCQARNNSDTVIRRYFGHGVTYPQAGTALYYGQDQLGSVRDVSAVQNGAKVGSFDYDPYGDVIAVSGRTTPEFRYAGLLYHGASGLYLANYRSYDPKAGRWLSRDPITERGGLNLYSYGHSNPESRVDRKGRNVEFLAALLGLGIVAANQYEFFYANSRPLKLDHAEESDHRNCTARFPYGQPTSQSPDEPEIPEVPELDEFPEYELNLRPTGGTSYPAPTPAWR